jgi:hypothetical protein
MVTGDRHGNATYCSRDCALRASRVVRRRALTLLKQQYAAEYKLLLELVWAERR